MSCAHISDGYQPTIFSVSTLLLHVTLLQICLEGPKAAKNTQCYGFLHHGCHHTFVHFFKYSVLIYVVK